MKKNKMNFEGMHFNNRWTDLTQIKMKDIPLQGKLCSKKGYFCIAIIRHKNGIFLVSIKYHLYVMYPNTLAFLGRTTVF